VNYVGGCHCGALRYVSTEAPGDVGYCHCRICQRTTAAPAVVFASFPVAGFRYTRGQPDIYASSTHGHREFCSRCGTQIAYREAGAARYVDVNAASLDDPTQVRPDHHIWWTSRIDWFDTDDDFPRYDEQRPGARP